MFAFFAGTLRAKYERHAVVLVNGVGYKVVCPAPLLEQLEPGQSVEFHIHTVVREDEISLYGFEKEEAIRLFELLLTVNGVGPRIAMDLFVWPIEKIKTAIAQKEVGALTQIHGIGKKTAERIVLELKDKVNFPSTGTPVNFETESDVAIPRDVLDALMGLGYQKRDIGRVFQNLDQPSAKKPVSP
jgi:Holliday junction DNA helicase RuvA